MIDKITARIKRYPFQTGIIIGCIICLLLTGFFSLFQDNGKTLSGNTDIIREDYLRMTINEYGQNRDDQMAEWRYKHLGSGADSTLQLMRLDTTISPQLLAAFANAIGKTDVLLSVYQPENSPEGTPASPRKGLSGFAKTLLIIIGLLVICAAGFYAASLIQTKKKQKLRSESSQRLRDEPMNVITPEKARSTGTAVPGTLFDLDELFPQTSDKKTTEPIAKVNPETAVKDVPDLNNELEKLLGEADADADADTEYPNMQWTEPSHDSDPHPETPETSGVRSDEKDEEDEPADTEDAIQPMTDPDETQDDQDVHEAEIDDSQSDADDENEPDFEEDPVTEVRRYSLDEEPETEAKAEALIPDPGEESPAAAEDEEIAEPENKASEPEESAEEPEPVSEIPDDAEKPLVETDPESEPENEDELLKMIRAGKTNSEELAGKSAEDAPVEDPEADPAAAEAAPDEVTPEEETDAHDEPAGDLLIHYQSTYRIGNDMYDEVFSIDQGDTFRGECGISIGETLNNTEPKAVTAFEVWLFDKDDIHTATWYLMSDFAASNEGISERLQQHGNCERIRKNAAYVLETETLQVEIRVLDLEYGTEMEEKNSYFTTVSFDITARAKDGASEEQS